MLEWMVRGGGYRIGLSLLFGIVLLAALTSRMKGCWRRCAKLASWRGDFSERGCCGVMKVGAGGGVEGWYGRGWLEVKIQSRIARGQTVG